MINGECAYACGSRAKNENTDECNSSTRSVNNDTNKIYLCVKEMTKKICPYVSNYSACPRYEPR